MEIRTEKNVMGPNLAERLNTALEASKQTVANLNEALLGKRRTRHESAAATEEVPAPVCPGESKSA